MDKRHEQDSTSTHDSLNFIERIIEEHQETGKFGQRVHTRFPPEPNGYLHIGHAKAICINFETAKKYGGQTNLRFDDTNPLAEKTDYVNAIQRDIKWLGYDWEDRLYFTSDYFQTLYDYAVKLIEKGLAYVDFSTPDEMNEQKRRAENSPYRDTDVATNLAEFKKMKNGGYNTGDCVLRLKIDMKADNRHMRDPLAYRIIKDAHHHRTGDAWCIYPMYDWAHGQSDSIEGITHSLCSLEFENHRPLYDWCQDKLEIPRSQQIEFSRLNLDYTVTSKRKLKQLIDLGLVEDWDDPRMPTLSGMRRRGYTPAAIRNFITRAGVSKRDQYLALSSLEKSVRDDLNQVAARVMTVLDPLKVVITNYPEGQVEQMPLENNPEDDSMGSRKVPFARELYIEQEDFRTEANRKWRRLAPGRAVRLKGAFIIEYEGHSTDANGNITEVQCKYYPDSRSGSDTSGIKAKGTLHWVAAAHALPVEVRLYERLFNDPKPTGHKETVVNAEGKEEEQAVDFKQFINPDSLHIVQGLAEPSLKTAQVGDQFQFLRLGYFCVDPRSTNEKLVFNRTATLRDSWANKG